MFLQPTSSTCQQLLGAQAKHQAMHNFCCLVALLSPGTLISLDFLLSRTSAGPLMAPVPSNGSMRGTSRRNAADSTLEHQESLPKLRVTGDALRKLMAEGTSGKTWPRMQSEASGRPPLPFKKKLLSPRADPGPPKQAGPGLSEVGLPSDPLPPPPPLPPLPPCHPYHLCAETPIRWGTDKSLSNASLQFSHLGN